MKDNAINPPLPESFNEKIINTYGDEGRKWLQALPTLIPDCEKQFSLKIGNR